VTRIRLAAVVLCVVVGVALAPLPADAQRAGAVPKIGVIRTPPSSDAPYRAFLQGLGELGYVEGKSILIEYRWGEPRQFPEHARELVRLNVELIFAPNPQAIQAAKQATSTIPIVFAVGGDPVRTGVAASLARPGGTATGLTALGSELGGKRLELLKEIVPGLARVAVLWNSAVPDKQVELAQMEAPARKLGLQLQPAEARGLEEFERAFTSIVNGRAQAMITLGEPLMYSHRALLLEFAAKHRLPAIFNWREFVEAGALIGYGPSISDLYRRAATYVHKILKGAKPGELPIEEAKTFELVINLRTARALGLTIPPSVLVRADHIIE
jgi:putative tryptophan/tyrosine transport system substrate-binding protein